VGCIHVTGILNNKSVNDLSHIRYQQFQILLVSDDVQFTSMSLVVETTGYRHINNLWDTDTSSLPQIRKLRYETPCNTAPSGVAASYCSKHAPGGKIVNYVQYRQSTYSTTSLVHFSHHQTLDCMFWWPQSWKIIANQLHTLIWHYTLLVYITLLLLLKCKYCIIQFYASHVAVWATQG
jgi:hypothetical protein